MTWMHRIFHWNNRYSNGDFSLRLVPVFRERLRVHYQRGTINHDLPAEYVGRSWKALDVRVPSELRLDELAGLVNDLQAGLREIGKEYVITQADGPDEVPQQERKEAITRLREIGFEPELLPDGRVKLKPVAPQEKTGSARDAADMATQLQAVQGRRTRVKELARSEGYQRAIGKDRD